jgi:hypothetical protein
MAEAVVDPVQVLDQQVPVARRIAEQRPDFFSRLRVDGSPLGDRADFSSHCVPYYQPASKARFLTEVK